MKDYIEDMWNLKKLTFGPYFEMCSCNATSSLPQLVPSGIFSHIYHEDIEHVVPDKIMYLSTQVVCLDCSTVYNMKLKSVPSYLHNTAT